MNVLGDARKTPDAGNFVERRSSARIGPDARARLKDQKAFVVWFTGLSGAGKSTLANAVEGLLHEEKRHTFMLDGDDLRRGLNHDLGFGSAARTENVRRVGHVARLMADAGLIVLVSLISPFRKDRRTARDLMPPGRFIEVYVHAPLQVVEARDPKGLYRKARQGLLAEFTGISSPYELPEQAELTIDTTEDSVRVSAGRIMAYLRSAGLLTPPSDGTPE